MESEEYMNRKSRKQRGEAEVSILIIITTTATTIVIFIVTREYQPHRTLLWTHTIQYPQAYGFCDIPLTRFDVIFCLLINITRQLNVHIATLLVAVEDSQFRVHEDYNKGIVSIVKEGAGDGR